MALTIYAVDQWHTPSVSHGYESIAWFTDRAVAEAYAKQCDARAIAEDWNYGGTTYTHTVDALIVDDPDILSTMPATDRQPDREAAQ